MIRFNILKKRKPASAGFFNIKNKNNGFTLVEILLVVGFIALAGIGIYTIYNKVQTSNTAFSEAKSINLTKTGIKNLYGGSVNYTRLSNKVLNSGSVTPENMRLVPYVIGDVNINNSFGESVMLHVISLSICTNNAFSIFYPNVTGGVCSKLVAAVEKDFEQIKVASSIVKTYGTNTIDVATLTASCSTDVGNGVNVVLEFI